MRYLGTFTNTRYLALLRWGGYGLMRFSDQVDDGTSEREASPHRARNFPEVYAILTDVITPQCWVDWSPEREQRAEACAVDLPVGE